MTWFLLVFSTSRKLLPLITFSLIARFITTFASSALSVMDALNNLERLVLLPGTTKIYVNVPTNSVIMIIDNIA